MNVETKSTIISALRHEGLISSLVAYYVYPKCLVRGGRLILGVVVSGGTAAEQHSYLLLLLLPILLLLTPPDVLCKTVFTPSAFASWLVPYLCLCLPRAEYQPVGLTSAERSVVQNDSLSVLGSNVQNGVGTWFVGHAAQADLLQVAPPPVAA